MRRQAGLSLIEMMIAMTISLFLLVGLAGIFANSSRTQNELTKTARQIEDGRFATTLVADDVGLAGYYGYYYQPAAPTALVDPCETNNMATIQSGMQLPIQGYDSPVTPPAPLSTCLVAANHLPGTDILVVRRADSQTTPVPRPMQANEVYLQANSNTTQTPVLDAGTGDFTNLKMRDPAIAAPIRKFHVRTYFVAPCSVPNGGGSTCTGASDDGGNPIPTLKRLELTVNAAGARDVYIVPLVEGVENMQIDYGIDTDADGTQDTWLTTPAAVADWANVMAVRVTLLMRNVEQTSGYVDTKTYNLGLAGNVTPGGAYRRHVYQTVVRLVNPSSRRETP